MIVQRFVEAEEVVAAIRDASRSISTKGCLDGVRRSDVQLTIHLGEEAR